MNINVAENMNTTVGSNQTDSIGMNRSQSVGMNTTQTVGGMKMTSVMGDASVFITGKLMEMIEGDVHSETKQGKTLSIRTRELKQIRRLPLTGMLRKKCRITVEKNLKTIKIF